MGDKDHFLGDDPGASKFKLGHGLARACALGDPRRPELRQAALDIDCGIGVGVGTRAVVDAERRLSASLREHDLAEGHAHPVVALRRRIDLPASRQGAGRHLGRNHVFRGNGLVHRHAPLAKREGDAGETEMKKVPSLRRHDPDQVRRVSAGPRLEAADSQPLSWGSPRNAGESRPLAPPVKRRSSLGKERAFDDAPSGPLPARSLGAARSRGGGPHGAARFARP